MYEFLDTIRQGHSQSIFACDGKLKCIHKKDIQLWNSKGYDIYYRVNCHPFRLKHINACYVDLDAGKAKGQYLKYPDVLKRKTMMIDMLHDFPIKPDYILETRNGYHVYWLINLRREHVSWWELLQRQLCSYFRDVGADSAVLKRDQPMRVPNTVAFKRNKKYTYLPFRTVLTTQIQGDRDEKFFLLKKILQKQPMIHTTSWSELESNKVNNKFKICEKGLNYHII